MLTKISEEQFADHFAEFKAAAAEFLPILCYTPAETDAFIEQFASIHDHTVCRIDHGNGQVTFYRYLYNPHMDGRSVQYIIPGNWTNRFALLREAIDEIKQDFLDNSDANTLFLRIKEDLPSHNAYFAGLLPAFGFDIQPRIIMTAEQDLITQLGLPALEEGFEEIPYQAELLSDFIGLYHQTEEIHETALSDAERAHNKAERIEETTNALADETGSKTCTGLAYKGTLIGFSFGQVWDDELSIEELGILPEFYGRGLGRYLTIRCMQKLHNNFAGSETFFAIGTDRTNIRALKLYHRLGFQIETIESYATLANSRFAAGS